MFILSAVAGRRGCWTLGRHHWLVAGHLVPFLPRASPRMSICVDAWRAAVGLWYNHQCKLPRSRAPKQPLFRFHSLIPIPKSVLLLITIYIVSLLLICGDIHPNPGPPPTKAPARPLSFCHLNARSILTSNDTGPRLHHIEQELVNDQKFDVLAVTETHLSKDIPDHDIALPNYQLFRKDRNRHGGGVCLYVKDEIAASKIPRLDNDDIEILWLKLHVNSKNIFFGVCYRPPGQNDQDKSIFLEHLESDLDHVTNLCGNSKHLILTGDFNDRTTDWHSNHTNSELGQDLYNLFNALGLHQIIDEPTRNENILDLIITNKPQLILNHGVLDPIHDLDHCPIYGKLNLHLIKTKPFSRQIWDYKAGDYNKLNDELLQIPWGMVTGQSENIDDAVTILTDLITQCTNNCIPHKTVTIHPNDKPGMTHKVKQLFKTARRLHKRAQRTQNPHDTERHRQARQTAKQEWKQAQDKYYANIENKLHNSLNDSRTYWKIVKHTIGNNRTENIPCIIDADAIATTDTEKTEILNNYFASQSTLPPDPNHQLPPLVLRTQNTLELIQTTPYEVYTLLTKLNTNKASGPDMISNKILKEAALPLAEPLSDIFNKSFLSGKFPTSWKCPNVIPIHKKGDRQVTSNYRPISLLSNISKLQERIVHKRLYTHCMENNLLTPHNSGFKPLDSTVNRLIHLTDLIYSGLDDKRDILITFLDISKAFDRVWHTGLLHKLREFGISGPLLKWFSDYLENRSQRVVIGGKKSTIKQINAGVPQGSILGPLLFLIFINDIIDNIENLIFLFADDASLVKLFHNIAEATISVNRDLQYLTQWAHTWRVTFNIIKTVFMIFSKKLTRHQPLIIMNDTPLKQVDDERYLGLILNSKMTWNSHINKLTSKASQKLGLLYTMKNKLSRTALTKYYITFIRPVLEYGSVVFDNCTIHESHLIEQVQRRAAVLCTGAFKRTSYVNLLNELGWESLDERRKKAKLTLMFKITKNLTPPYLKELIPPQIQDTTQHRLRNRTHIRIPRSRTSFKQKSFIPATLNLWNNLDPEIKRSRTLATFKSKQKFRLNPMTKLYSTNFGPSTKLLTQIRLGLSKLNLHLFTHSIIPDPFCPHCPASRESPMHYFLQCPAYAAQRDAMSRDLRGLLAPESFTHTKLLYIIIHGNQTDNLQTNISIFQTVHNYITSTKRF